MDISSMLEVQVNEVKDDFSEENVSKRDHSSVEGNLPTAVSAEEKQFYKSMFGNDIASVRFRRLHCTACDVHIGSAPADACNMFEHPLLRTLLCRKCRDFYGDGTFEQGYDNTDMFCRWCANGGTLYCCYYCSNTFCDECIKRNFYVTVRKRIKNDKEWKCFVCDPKDLYSARALCWALLQHVKTVTRILQNDQHMSLTEVNEKLHLDESGCCPRKKKRKRIASEAESDELEQTLPTNSSAETIFAHSNKMAKRLCSRKGTNGISRAPVPIRPLIKVQRPSDINQDIKQTITPPERPLITRENQVLTYDKSIAKRSLKSTTNEIPVIKTYKSSNLKNTNVYSQAIINAIPTATLLQKPITQGTGITPTTTLHMGFTSSAPMVSIPNKVNSLLNRGRVILPQKASTVQTIVHSSNVIDLDSDSDEPVVVEQSENSLNLATYNESEIKGQLRTAITVSSPSVNFTGSAVPVALVSTDANVSKIQSDKQLIEKTKSFYKSVLQIVTGLTYVNDRIVREYASFQKKATPKSDEPDSSTLAEFYKSPLEMHCSSDSSTESDNDELKIIEPNEWLLSTKLEHFLGIHDKKSCKLRDKSIQVDDVIIKDYEKCISHSVISKIASDNNVLLSNTQYGPDENFGNGKYEEEFIKYLQYIEDHGIETEDMQGIPEIDDVSLKMLVNNNSPFITKLFDKETRNSDSSQMENVMLENDNSTAKDNVDKLKELNQGERKDLGELQKRKYLNVDNVLEKDFAETSNNTDVTKEEHISIADIKLKERIQVRTELTRNSFNAQEEDCTIID
ncbi:uncharacterized protein ADD1 isoform X2 [Prorops nasuta]|uniref:uncharacterized protein ADD1 isoform X2 n=1 Tax=Prorops nasuta TaxID=863751 RepID=UPI0034CD802B